VRGMEKAREVMGMEGEGKEKEGKGQGKRDGIWGQFASPVLGDRRPCVSSGRNAFCSAPQKTSFALPYRELVDRPTLFSRN